MSGPETFVETTKQSKIETLARSSHLGARDRVGGRQINELAQYLPFNAGRFDAPLQDTLLAYLHFSAYLRGLPRIKTRG